MNVVCNGFPKSGNHALVKACQLLGVPATVNHISYAEGIPLNVTDHLFVIRDPSVTHHLFVVRDPRNVVVSWLRYNNMTVSPGMFLTAFRKFDRGSLIEDMASYEGWLHDKRTYVIRYESLIANDKTMRKMAAYVDVPYLPGAWELLPGLTVTWNAEHSDYRKLWTPELDAAWKAEGGPELLARWGY